MFYFYVLFLFFYFTRLFRTETLEKLRVSVAVLDGGVNVWAEFPIVLVATEEYDRNGTKKWDEKKDEVLDFHA